MEELIAYRLELLSAMQGIIENLSTIVDVTPSNAWSQSHDQHLHTPHYTLAHLRDIEANWFAVQLPRFLQESTPVLPAWSDKEWEAGYYQPEEAIGDISQELSRLRSQELAWLRPLSSEGWSRIARHPWHGLHTIQWWVELQLELSQQHLQKLTSLLGK